MGTFRASIVAGAIAVTALISGVLWAAGTAHPADGWRSLRAAVRKSLSRKPRTDEVLNFYMAESTRRMAALLAKLGNDADARLIDQQPDRHLARYTRGIGQPTDLRTATLVQAKEAYELLLAGDSEAAARHLQHVRDTVTQHSSLFDHTFLGLVRDYLAIAFLRMGEQDNCISRHGADSCLLPISRSGVHTVTRGSRAAIDVYQEILDHNPRDLSARWLLNIAYMTLGEYPEAVPKQWRIPPEVFKSEFDQFGRFRDVAPQLGVDVRGLAGGVVLEDFDGDGYLDLMVSSFGLDAGRDQLRYFHNNGDGTFSDDTRRAGLSGVLGGINLVQADYNNDGFPDVLVLRGGSLLGDLGRQPPSLLRNNGDGTFDDVTAEAGLLALHPTQTAAWGDYDNDGWLDLFVGIESSDVPGFELPLYRPFARQPKEPCKLYHNNGNGTFTDVARDAGLAVLAQVKGAAWGDYDNDGRLDLYLSTMYGPNLLFKNTGRDSSGKWRFTNVLATEPWNSSVTWFWDYDNDGWLDLFAAGYSPTNLAGAAGQVAASYLGLPVTAETPRLFRNNRDGSFTDVTREVHLSKVPYVLGGNFGDFDNDGWLDFYVGTGGPDYRMLMPNRMFRNADGRVFQDVTSSAGVGHLQKGHAVAVGDINNDGAQDMYVVIGGEYPGDTFPNALFLNPGSGNHWITLRLEGVESNRSAIGARVKVTVQTEHGQRAIYRTVTSGGSLGASTLRQEVGLGRATSIRSIEIRWPRTGRVQIFNDVKMDQIVGIREGDSAMIPTRAGRFAISPDSSLRHEHVHPQ